MNRNGIIVGVVVALAIVGGVYAYQTWIKAPSLTEESMCGYAECGWIGSVTLRKGDSYPPTCSKCNRNSVLKPTPCSKCGNQQIINYLLKLYIDGKSDLPDDTKCNKCGARIKWGD